MRLKIIGAVTLFSILVIGIYFVFNSNKNSIPVTFETFELLEKRNAQGLGYPEDNEKYFLVTSYTDKEKAELTIDSFVCQQMKDIGHFNDIENTIRWKLYFFRKTKITNSNHLKDLPKDLFRYSLQNDLICKYEFDEKGKAMIYYFKEQEYKKIVSEFSCFQ